MCVRVGVSDRVCGRCFIWRVSGGASVGVSVCAPVCVSMGVSMSVCQGG